MAGEVKHTPTPWVVSESATAIAIKSVETIHRAPKSFGHRICKMATRPDSTQGPFGRADAAFLVRAVNSHEALVEALQAIRDGLRSDGRVWVDNGSGSREAGPDLRSFIDAALAECAKPLSEVA